MLDIFDYCFGRPLEFDPFVKGKKKKEHIKKLKAVIYLQFMVNDLLSMFEYQNVPKGLNTDFLELFKLKEGMCGLTKVGEDIVCFPCSLSQDLDYYGLGTHMIGATRNGIDFDVIRDVDGVLAQNNALMSPELPNLIRFAEQLVQTDISIDFNLFYSRYAPIIKAKNQSERDTIKDLIENMEIGEILSMVTDDFVEEINGNSEKLINLTDVKNSDKIQYLSKFHDDLLRRLYTFYGHAMSGTEKMAQQSVDEIGRNDTVSMIYPLARLKYAKKMCEDVNRLFGTNMTVDFSEAWKTKKEEIESEIVLRDNEQTGSEFDDVEGGDENDD